MKTTLAIFALALGAAMSLQGAQASDTSRTISTGKAVQNQNAGEDLSAAKKKRKQVYVQNSRYVLGPDGYYYPRAGTPGDPSWQSPVMLQKRAAGECIIDLGYGRWESCANAGGGGRR